MKIKIATWNMAYWLHKNFFEESWDYFLNGIDADIYFFQEARPSPKITEDKKHLVWSEIGGSRPWGSGIYSKKYRLTEEKIKTDYNGVFSIANTKVNNTKLTLISLYGLITDTYAITNLHRILSDLTPILNGHIDGRRNIILGGDLNASIQCDKISGNNSHKIFFERLEDFKLNDYFFISNSLSKKLSGCEMIDNDKVRQYSDHNPVVITLEI